MGPPSSARTSTHFGVLLNVLLEVTDNNFNNHPGTSLLQVFQEAVVYLPKLLEFLTTI